MISVLFVVGFLAVVNPALGAGEITWCRHPHTYLLGYLDPGTNLALNQATEQISNYIYKNRQYGQSSKAVDGNTNGNWKLDSVTHTAGGEKNPWWKLTLAKRSYVHKIEIYNRVDCCQDRLNGANIYLDNNLVGTVSYTQGRQKYTFGVGRSGQVVMVNKTTTSVPLSMAEVVVMGVEVDGGKDNSLEEALAQCIGNAGCTGVTKPPFVDSVYSMRKGELFDSPADRNVTSWVLGACEDDAWCEHPHKYVEEYTGGEANQDNVKYSTLEKAQAKCIEVNSQSVGLWGNPCDGVTKDAHADNVYSLRKGDLLDSTAAADETSWTIGACHPPEEMTLYTYTEQCVQPAGEITWCRHPHTYLLGYLGGKDNQANVQYSSLEEALAQCIGNAGCTGVTKHPFVDSVYSMRKGELFDSPADRDATSWTMGACGDPELEEVTLYAYTEQCTGA